MRRQQNKLWMYFRIGLYVRKMFVLLIIAMRKHDIKNTITKRTKLFTCWVASNNNNKQIYIAFFFQKTNSIKSASQQKKSKK